MTTNNSTGKKPTKKTKPTQHKEALKKRWLIITIIITGLLVSAAVSLLFYFKTLQNPAYTATKPIEAALLKQGAIKKCETGDPGRGPDNNEPWYEAYYIAGGTKEDTMALLRSLSGKGNGPLFKETGYDKNEDGIVFRGVSINTTATVMADKTFSLHPDTCINESTLTGTTAHPIVHLRLRIPQI